MHPSAADLTNNGPEKSLSLHRGLDFTNQNECPRSMGVKQKREGETVNRS